MDAAGARDRDTIELSRREIRRSHLFTGTCEHALEETEPWRRPDHPREPGGRLSRKAEHDFGSLDQLPEAPLLLGAPPETEGTDVIGWGARRRQQRRLPPPSRPAVG